MKSSTRPLANFPCLAVMAALFHLGIFGGRICAQTSHNPQPMATAQLSEWLQPDAGKSVHSTLTFLSDDTVALLLCGDRVANCRLAVLQISNGRINTVAHKDLGQLPYNQVAIDSLKHENYTAEQVASFTASMEEATRYGLYRYGSGFVVRPFDFYTPTVQWYSRDLSVNDQIPNPDLISRAGGAVASRIRDTVPYVTWTIYRVSSSVPPATQEVRVVSNLLALSDDELAAPEPVKLESARPDHPAPVKVQIQTLDGQVLDSAMGLGETAYYFGDSSKENVLGRADFMEFAKGGQFYLPDWSGRDEIVNAEGKRLMSFRPPGVWQGNDRHGWAADGSRLLYDRYTQLASLGRRIEEDAVLVPLVPIVLYTGGALYFPAPVLPENKNHEEVVRVFDTASGKTCFEWISQNNDLDSLREYHADISPNGQHVAVLTPSKLALYDLPASCMGHN